VQDSDQFANRSGDMRHILTRQFGLRSPLLRPRLREQVQGEGSKAKHR
jgi:hypothetical protein